MLRAWIGLNAFSPSTPAQWLPLLTTVTFWTTSPNGFWNLIVDADFLLKEITPHGWSKNKLVSLQRKNRATTVHALCNANLSGSKCRRKRVKQKVKPVWLPMTSCMQKHLPQSAVPTSWKSTFQLALDLATTSYTLKTFPKVSGIAY